MTSSSPARRAAQGLVLSLVLAAPWAQAALGEAQSSVDADSSRMHARRSVARAAQYAVHELAMADGSRVRQYVAGNGRVFAVSWHTLYKPDLAAWLGSSFAAYHSAAHAAARQGGVQRQFRHAEDDLVVQSSGHLTVYNGYAYRPSLMPPGVSPQTLGLG